MRKKRKKIESKERMLNMSVSKNPFKVYEHYFGAYNDGGEYSLIHWTGKKHEFEELKKRSSVEPIIWFPYPKRDFCLDNDVLNILGKANSAFAAVYYRDCQGAFVACSLR
ncbi:MAG: hypothetical protein V1770_00970 [bacterium]